MWIKPLLSIVDGDRHLVGGKALALSRLARLDIAVPGGFVITTAAFEELLRLNRLSTDDPDIAERLVRAHLPNGLGAEISECLKDLQGTLYAVRSSAVSEDSADRSFAGIFESYLNVRAEHVVAHVRKCYASLFSPRARHYLGRAEPIAVVVQEMVDSRLSGVLFTKDPLDRHEGVALVECCHGLGELLVSGEITPDRYLLDKRSGVIIEREAGAQSLSLTGHGDGNVRLPLSGTESPITAVELRSLVAIARRVEESFDAPCDIEWCIDDRGVSIVQSRPVTAVAAKAHPSSDVRKPRYTKRFFSRILSPVFEEANVYGFYKFARDQFELPFSLSGYHVYQPSVNHPNGEVDIWVDDELDRQVKGWMKGMIRSDSGYLKRVEKRYLSAVDGFTDFCDLTAKSSSRDTSTSGLAQVLQVFDAINQRMTSLYNAPILVVTALAELVNEEMRAQNPASYDEDFVVLAFSDIPNSVFLQEVEFLRILLVAKERHGNASWSPRVLEYPEVRDLLAEYHRRWRFLACTDVIGDAFPLAHFETMLQVRYHEDAAGTWRELAERQAEESRKLREVKRRYQRLHYEIFWLRTWLFHRNHTTEHYYRDFQQLGGILREVARRLDLSYRDVLQLSVSEIVRALDGSLSDYATRSKERGRDGFSLAQEGSCVALRTGVAAEDRLETVVLQPNELSGQVANRGHATGTVRIVRDPVGEAGRFRAGDILVTAMTTPSFVPLMERAGAIVTDEGGVLCHAALVSREMNKPCVIAVHNATQVLTDGMLVTVNAETGRILVLTETG